MEKVIADIETRDTKVDSASKTVEAFNCHFANRGHELARDIPRADTVPESYPIQKMLISKELYFTWVAHSTMRLVTIGVLGNKDMFNLQHLKIKVQCRNLKLE